MKHKLRRSLITSTSILALTAVLANVSYAYDGLVESCPVNTSTDYGGVSLNKTLTLLNNMSNIQGAAYDPGKGQIVFVGDGAEVALDERIEMDDLVVAVRSVYGPLDEQGEIIAPGISFNTAADWVPTGQDDVVYSGNTENTAFGQLLYDADYVLKTLGQGVDENGTLLKNIPSLMAAVPSYESAAEKFIVNQLDLDGLNLEVQFWIEPKTVNLDDYSEGGAEFNSRSFKFTNVEMQVVAKVIDKTTGQAVTSGPEYSAIIGVVQEFASNISTYYDAIAQVPGFEALEKIKRLAKLVAVVRWMKTERIPVDLSFMANYTPVHTPTPDKVNILQLCKSDGSNGIDGVKSGLYGGGNCGTAVYGGVVYNTVNTYNPLTQADALIAASLDQNSVVDGSLGNEGMVWRFTSNSTEYKAVAQTLGQQRKDGGVSFGNLDLGLPNSAGQSLSLYRYYNSFANDIAGFGPGWSEYPFTMSFPESEVVVCNADNTACTEGLGALVGYPKVNVVDRITGRTVPFDVAGPRHWKDSNENIVKVTPYYVTVHSNDLVYLTDNGDYVYEQRDSHNKVTKGVIFKPRPAQYGTVLYADVSDVGVLGVGPDADSDGAPDGIWTSYLGNTAGQLTEIRSNVTDAYISLTYQGERIASAQLIAGTKSRSVEYSYNFGRLENVKLSNGHLIKYAYKDQVDYTSGVVADVVDVTRNLTLASIDSDVENRGTLLVPQDNTARQVDTVYDRPSGLMTSTDGLGRVFEVERDNTTRLTGTSVSADVSGAAVTYGTRYVYNSTNPVAGPETVTGVRNETTTFAYDPEGNVTSVTLNDLGQAASIERGLRAVGQGFVSVKVLTDAKNRKSALEYDSNGRLITIHRRVTGVSSQDDLFTYTPVAGYSQTISYDSNSGAVSRVIYDSSALNATYPWIASTDEQVEYSNINERGQAEAVLSAAGFMTTLQYDELARLQSRQGPADVSATTVSYYETGLAQDAPSTVTNPVGVISQSFDVVKRIQRVTDAKGVVTASFRNADGQLTRVVEASPSGKTVLTTRYFYDVHGRLIRKLLPSGTEVTYSYDEFGRLKSMAEIEEGSVATDANLTLVSTPPSVANVDATGSFGYDVNVASSLDEGIKYYLVNGPDGLAVDEATGEISWDASGVSVGEYVVVLQAVSDSGGVVDYSFSVNVPDSVSAIDSDGDAIYDIADNCINAANADQRDTDGDGYGNACDPDLNNDGVVSFADLALFKSWYGSADVDADFNGDGTVNDVDRDVLDTKFGGSPGPSAKTQ